MTSTQGCEGKETAPYGIDDLTPRQRRRLLTASVIRSLAAVSLIVTAYFLLPFSRLSNLRLIVEFVAGLLLVMVVFSAQTVATLRTRYPVLRTFEALVVSGPTFLVVFSTTHYLINWQHPGSYSEPMTRLDALYFTIATFATVGFGDITPVSEPARVVTMFQMVGGLIVVGIVARVLVDAARLRVQDRDVTTRPPR